MLRRNMNFIIRKSKKIHRNRYGAAAWLNFAVQYGRSREHVIETSEPVMLPKITQKYATYNFSIDIFNAAT